MSAVSILHQRDKYHCQACGKLKRMEGSITIALGDKVNFTITSWSRGCVRAKAAKGTVIELLDCSAIVTCRGKNYQVPRASVTHSAAPSPLTYELSELCECPKEPAAESTAIEHNHCAPEL